MNDRQTTSAPDLATHDEKDLRRRLAPSTFDLPVAEIRAGYRSAVYFWRAKRILEQEGETPRITHQLFQKEDDVRICGVDEAIAILKCGAGEFRNYTQADELAVRLLELRREAAQTRFERDGDALLRVHAALAETEKRLDDLWVERWSELDVQALYDGDAISAWETVMLIEGDYPLFSHLESLYLGVLARRTSVLTYCHRVVRAANGKPVLYFADRFDDYHTQEGDGYAALLGGVFGVASDAMGAWHGKKGLGTIPHAMIVSYDGDSVAATEKFDQYYPEVNTISLVDFDNDCARTAVAAARRLGERLWGVRLDTAENLVDVSLKEETQLSDKERFGVVPALAGKVREALDREGFQNVKIIVSGGFNPERIAQFEERGAPVDSYAVGSWILTGNINFTADAVRKDGKPLAKVGREYKPNPRLKHVE